MQSKIINSRTPGAFIKEKEIGISWHYEYADLKFGDWQAAELQNHIHYSLQHYPIHVLKRHKCIEVYLRDVSKASAIRRIFSHHQRKLRRRSVTGSDDPNGVAIPAANSRSNSSRNFSMNTPGSISMPPSSFNQSDSILEERLCDFIFCMGDDRTDEYMFEYLQKIVDNQSSNRRIFSGESRSPSALFDLTSDDSVSTNIVRAPKTKLFTCTVGVKSSNAKWHVSNISDALQGLELIANF